MDIDITRAMNDPSVVDGTAWARPTTWRSSGVALTVVDGVIYVVPQGVHRRAWTPRHADVVAEWEVVDPSEVLDEVDYIRGLVEGWT